LSRQEEGVPKHRQIIVVDFEYASLNPAAFDIANHFHEWTANYHSSTPHLLDPSRYPTLEQRRNFYSAYIRHSYPALSNVENEKMMTVLDLQVRAWSPASQAMWGLWGIIEAREVLETGESESEFDYIAYAQQRIQGFRGEIQALGVLI
jgi:choline kinase